MKALKMEALLNALMLTFLLKHFKNELRSSLPGDFYRVPLEYGRGEVAHQSLGATSSNIGSESPPAASKALISSA